MTTRAREKKSDTVTIKEIAARCQLSTSTVSHVLNGQSGRYSEDTAQRVWRAIRELGYQPNHIGRMLRKGNDWLYGALVPNLANVFYADFVHALDIALQSQDRLLLTVSVGDTLELQQRTMKNMNGAMLAGLVLIGSTAQELHQIVTLSHRNTRLVFVNRGTTGLYANYCGVGIDNFGAGKDLAVVVRRGGRRRLALLRGPDFSYASRQRYEGFLAGWVDHGPDVAIVYDATIRLTPDAGFAAAQEAVGQNPDVIYCGNDMVALGVLEYCATHGIRVPDQILITGFDYNSMTQVLGQRLMTVAQPIDAMALTVAEWLSMPQPEQPVHRIMPHRVVLPRGWNEGPGATTRES